MSDMMNEMSEPMNEMSTQFKPSRRVDTSSVAERVRACCTCCLLHELCDMLQQTPEREQGYGTCLRAVFQKREQRSG